VIAPDLAGKVAVITGANSGIGKETAVAVAQAGAHVVVAARNPTKAAAAVTEIETRAGAQGRVEYLPLDLASFAAVHQFAAAFTDAHDRCDLLVNNAGLIQRKRSLTVDGHETQFQVNHLSHFLLTNLLLDTMQKHPGARVVNVASGAHRSARRGLDFDDLDWSRRRYRAFKVYASTKLMNILFTRAFARRHDGGQISANAVHPGWVASNFGREGDWGPLVNFGMIVAKPFALSPAKGAITSIYVAESPDVDGMTGLYFEKCKVVGPSPAALDDAAGERLWEISEKLTAG